MKYTLLVLLLSSCALFESDIEFKEVLVPVVTPCLSKEKLPAQSIAKTDSLSSQDNIYVKTEAILFDKLSYEAENNTLRALLNACLE